MPQVPAWAEANKPRVLDSSTLLDRELKSAPFVAGDRYSVADITALVAVDFMKPAKLAVPDDARPMSSAGTPRCRRGRARRRKPMRLTIVGSGDAFGSGGRFNTCFWLETAKGTLLVDCGASSLLALKARSSIRTGSTARALASAWRPFRRPAVFPARCAVPERGASGR